MTDRKEKRTFRISCLFLSSKPSHTLAAWESWYEDLGVNETFHNIIQLPTSIKRLQFFFKYFKENDIFEEIVENMVITCIILYQLWI